VDWDFEMPKNAITAGGIHKNSNDVIDNPSCCMIWRLFCCMIERFSIPMSRLEAVG